MFPGSFCSAAAFPALHVNLHFCTEFVPQTFTASSVAYRVDIFWALYAENPYFQGVWIIAAQQLLELKVNKSYHFKWDILTVRSIVKI